MIWESAPWKQELRRHRNSLVKAGETELYAEVSNYRIERALLFSAIAMRRLIESRKVTDTMRATKFAIEAFPTLPSRHDVLARLLMKGDIDREFDLKAGSPLALDCWDISSEIIHSGFLSWEVDDDGKLCGIMLASIRNQRERLLRIPLATYLQLINGVLVDHVVSAVTRLTPEGRLDSKLS